MNALEFKTHFKPKPQNTIFHAINVLITLIGALQSARHFAKYGIWVSIVSFAVALILIYLISFYAIGYLVLWLWDHSWNWRDRYWRLRHEAACYLLATVRSNKLAEEIAHWWDGMM